MEQTTQQITQKPSLPIKTKIAAWWMMIIGSISLAPFLFFSCWFIMSFSDILSGAISETAVGGMLVLGWIFSLLFVISFFVPGFFLLKRKKWSFGLAVIMLAIDIFSPIFLFGFGFSFFDLLIPISIFVFPLILLLLDRKNFFKIAS